MLKKYLKKSLALLLLSANAPRAFAAECTDRPKPVTFYFQNTQNTANIPAVCYYTDEYFTQSGTIPDSHLRTMSLSMAMSAFESWRSDAEDYRDRCENFSALMKEIGFRDLKHNDAYDKRPEENSIGIAAARKKITAGGTSYTVLAVGIRGAGYEAEWAGNIRIGKTGRAEGFSQAADQVLRFISDYEKEYGIRDHAKIWISGFSRAGAVANLAAAEMNRDPARYATSADDIYCYTFEAPQGEEQNAAGQYRNIHNTISPADLVPLIPLSEWGFSRAGYTQPGQAAPYSQDDLLLPAPGSSEYRAGLRTMLDRLAEINPEIEYAIDRFTASRFTGFRDNTGSGTTAGQTVPQAEFIQEFLTWVNSTIPDENRASFAEHYQNAFADIARIYMGSPRSTQEKMNAALTDSVKDWTFYLAIGAMVLTITARGSLSSAVYEEGLRTSSGILGNIIVRHMKQQQAGLPEEDYQALKNAVYPIVRFADSAIEDDFKNHHGYHFVTLIFNLDPVLQAHYPEICLAWMQTMDSYFTESLKTEHAWDAGTGITPANTGSPAAVILYTCRTCGKTKKELAGAQPQRP